MVETVQEEKPTKPKDLIVKPVQTDSGSPLTATTKEEGLNYQRLKFLYETKIRPVADALQEAEGLTKELRLDHERRMAEFALSLRMGKLDEDALGAFWKKPYPKLDPARDSKGRLISGTWRLSIPRFIPLSVGFLESQDEAWNYFRVNRHMDWFGEIPDFIKKQIGMKEHPEFEGLKIEGGDLVGPTEIVKKAWGDKHLKRFFDKMDGNRIKIDKNRAYDLTVALLREGVKPFSQNPIDPADIITPPPLPEGKQSYELRPYQKTIWETLCKFSSVGLFIPPSTGKTVIGVYAGTHLRPPHLIVVPTNTLAEQWAERIEHHSALKLNQDVFIATYISAIKKMSNREWTLVIFDEVHHIGAKYFIKLSWLRRKYSLSLSATPYREDQGGEELIFALTGEPCLVASALVKQSDSKWTSIERLTSTSVSSANENLEEEVSPSRQLPAVWGSRRPIKLSTIGKGVVATDDHPFLVHRNGLEQWLPAHDVKLGDLIATTPDIPCGELIRPRDFISDIIATYNEKQERLVEAYRYAMKRRRTAGVWKTILETRAKFGTCNTNWFYGAKPRPLMEIEDNDRTFNVAWLYKLLGFLYGDGSLDKMFCLQIGVHEEEGPRIARELQSADVSFGRVHSKHRASETFKIYDYTLARLLKSFGLSVGSKQDQPMLIPKILSGVDQNIQARNFISGFFGAEGSVRMRGLRAEIILVQNTHRREYLAPFIDWIRGQLEGYGIRCHLSTRITKERSVAFILTIADHRSTIRFLHLFSFAFSPRKQARANMVLASLLMANKGMADRQRLKSRILSLQADGRSMLSLEKEFEVPDSTIAMWRRNPNSDVTTQGLEYSIPRVTSDIRWEQVSEVEYCETNESIFDLQVEKNNDFIADGFLVHNCGLAWQYFRDLRIIKSPVCHVWIERNLDAKLRRLADLLKEPKKTIIFSDSLELGKSVAARYKIPHIFGQSVERLKTLEESQTAVISRVGDEGVSLPDIERVIEISWLFGSRRQELQRFTRLLHGQKVEGEGHVLMTVDEYLRDKKRLFSIMDRGFKIVLHREGVDEKVLQSRERAAESSHRGRVSNKGPSTSPVALPQIASTISERLPGVNRTLERLDPVERAVAQTILANPTRPYTAKELVLATGYSAKTIENLAHFSKLVKQGLIKREKGGNYQSAL